MFIFLLQKFKFKKAPSNRGLRLRARCQLRLPRQFKKAPSNRGLRQMKKELNVEEGKIQKSPIKSGIKTP